MLPLEISLSAWQLLSKKCLCELTVLWKDFKGINAWYWLLIKECGATIFNILFFRFLFTRVNNYFGYWLLIIFWKIFPPSFDNIEGGVTLRHNQTVLYTSVVSCCKFFVLMKMYTFSEKGNIRPQHLYCNNLEVTLKVTALWMCRLELW